MSSSEWYCKAMGIEFGPMSFEDLAGLVERGNVRRVDPVRNGVSGPWLKVSDVPELAARLPKAAGASTTVKQPSPLAKEPSPLPPAASVGRATPPPDPLGWEATVGQYELEPLDRYNCAILIGADGVTVCDLREALPIALKGARVIGHRSPDDSSPVRCGPLEVQLSVRQLEVSEAQPKAPVTAVADATEFEVSEADVTANVEPVTPKPTVRRPSKQSETSDVAAEMLRRMFMPQASKGR